MVDFSSIAVHLQVNIVEKLDYLHQKQFQLSSKHGKHIGNRTKHRSVLQVYDVVSDNEDFIFRREDGTDIIQWTELREMPGLPLFEIEQLWINNGLSLNSVNDLSEKAVFGNNEIIMIWDEPNDQIPMFFKLMEMFNITTMDSNLDRLDPDFFYIPKFCEMKELSITVNFMSKVEKLLMLKPISIEINEMSVPQAVDAAKSFLMEWANKERDIHWFATRNKDQLRFQHNLAILTGLRWTHYYGYVKGRHFQKITYLKETTTEYLHKCDNIYLIDRGDKKLLLAFHNDRGYGGAMDSWSRVIALEFTNLEDEIKIEDCEWAW